MIAFSNVNDERIKRVVEENLVGKTLGDYILREKLTSGGMAHIYLGEDEKLGRHAAIKILSADVAGKDDVLRERFAREARAVANLEHDNIVPIYQFGEVGHLYFIAMRYIMGNDLADEMKAYQEHDEKMPVDRLLNIMAQVASALDHAHKRGIIHRDVKPSNVLLLKDARETGDKAILTDFGLVLWEDMSQTLGTAFGTPRYISPEQATDSQSALPQSDIYSLAVIIYEILTGTVLFTGNTPMEVALSHITELPKPPRAHNPDIPADAQREILKALQKDAQKRHTTASKFINALREAYDLHDTGTKPRPIAENSSTIAVRQETASVIAEWDNNTVADMPRSEPSIPQAHPEPMMQAESSSASDEQNSEEKKGGLRIFAIVGVVIALIALAGGYMLSQGGNVADDSAETNMNLLYNEDFFAIKNITDDALLDITALSITGESGESGREFGTLLAPGECRVVRRGNSQDGDIPSSWNCADNAFRIESNQTLYWRADDEADTSFEVTNNNEIAHTCETAGRAVGNAGNNVCAVAWSTYTMIETETE